VPWRQAGPGWSVVEYSVSAGSATHQPAKSSTILSLVSPQGRKFPFYVSPEPANRGIPDLIDWSGDRQRVLVQQGRSADAQEFWYEQISLATGAVLTRFKLPERIFPIGFTRPAGASLLVTGFRTTAVWPTTA
jgi:hypothetical protein